VADQLKRVVVDTSVVLDLLINVDDDLASRAQYLLDGHGDRHTIVLPAIVIPEGIAGAGNVRGDHLPSAVRKERINAAMAWIRSSNYVVAELSERTAHRAAEIGVSFGVKGADATVLATAEEWGTHLYARDGGLLSCDGQFPFKISEPEDPPEPVPDLFTDG
jgi:predicted nucleic acid-binding protein